MSNVGVGLLIVALALVVIGVSGVTVYDTTAYGIALVCAVTGAAFILADDGS